MFDRAKLFAEIQVLPFLHAGRQLALQIGFAGCIKIYGSDQGGEDQAQAALDENGQRSGNPADHNREENQENRGRNQ